MYLIIVFSRQLMNIITNVFLNLLIGMAIIIHAI